MQGSDLDDVDIVTGSAFSGLTTFAHVPYSNCFVDGDEVEGYDIAILGAPFDTVSAVWFLLVLTGRFLRSPSSISSEFSQTMS